MTTKLLRPGYAGYLQPAEVQYILHALRGSQRLRDRWGINPTVHNAATLIRRVAMG